MNIESHEILPPLEQAKNLCRVCLLSNQNNQLIFDRNYSDSESQSSFSLLQKLVLYGGIEVLKDDGFPDRICVRCISKINAAHELRIQCQEADETLRKAFGKPFKNYRLFPHTFQKDQYCQTETELYFNTKSIENNVLKINESNNTEFLEREDNWNDFQDTEDDITNTEFQDSLIYEEDCSDENGTFKEQFRSPEKNQVSQKRESIKARRASVFKRVTSIENLRNHKERQRQYIKKSTNTKSDPSEQDLSSRRKVLDSKHELNNTCSTCNRSFSSEKSLERHVFMHAEKLKCAFCGKQFFKQEKLLSHEKLHESKGKREPVHCKICDKSFRKTDTMVRHLNVHKKANPKEVFNILKEMRDKRKAEKESDDFIRISGDEISEREENSNEFYHQNSTLINSQKEHINYSDMESTNVTVKVILSESNSSYHCKYCIKCYSSEKALQRHLLVHEEKKFCCNVCNMKFVRQDRLESHRERYGHDEDKDYSSEPDKPPDDKSALKLINSWIREELDSDNEGKGFPCEICGKSYVTKKSLSKHRANVHEAQDDTCNDSCEKESRDRAEKVKPYSCAECGKSFEKESKLQKHKSVHERAKEQQDTNFKRFLCHICSKTFRQNTGLMFHMRTHTGYKPHVCKYCGRGFTSNSNCINHERTHTGDRPFVCHFCSAAFAKSCTLKAHITTHTGEANYHCKTCGKSFRRLKYLKEHRFTHTGEKPYACKLCGTAYSHSGSLFVHEKKCKAHYSNNYQTVVTQNVPNYCQSQNAIGISPILSTLPIPGQQILENGALNIAQNNKTYVLNMQRNGVQAGLAGNPALVHVHSPGDVQDVTSAVRNFAIIEQVFRS